jgi:hypothetical protein
LVNQTNVRSVLIFPKCNIGLNRQFTMEKQLRNARNLLHRIILEQRAATEELRSSNKEMEALLDEVLASRSDLRKAHEEIRLEAEPRQPLASLKSWICLIWSAAPAKFWKTDASPSANRCFCACDPSSLGARCERRDPIEQRPSPAEASYPSGNARY